MGLKLTISGKIFVFNRKIFNYFIFIVVRSFHFPPIFDALGVKWRKGTAFVLWVRFPLEEIKYLIF